MIIDGGVTGNSLRIAIAANFRFNDDFRIGVDELDGAEGRTALAIDDIGRCLDNLLVGHAPAPGTR